MQSSTFRGAIVLTALLASASTAWTQTVTDARRIEFSPSAEHNAVDGNGVAILDRYSLQVFVAGGATPLQTVDLGKPAPAADGMIRLDFVSLLPTPLATGVLYETLVESIGPGGRAASLRSNTFSFTAPCTWTISPTSQSFTPTGGTGSSTVTAIAGCTWTAVSNNTWISVSAGASGSGNGSVSFTVAANTGTSTRVGTLTIAGSTYTVTQAAPCSYTISPTSRSHTAAGGTGSVTVTAAAGCGWTATSGASWVTIGSGASGSGNGSVSYTAAANTATSARTATLTIAGRTFTVDEAAAACTFTVSPRTITEDSAGGTGTIAVTTQAGCAWSATEGASWITLTGSGPGSGSTAFTIAANTGTTSRTATLTVAGLAVSVTQAPPTIPSAPDNLRIIR